MVFNEAVFDQLEFGAHASNSDRELASDERMLVGDFFDDPALKEHSAVSKGLPARPFLQNFVCKRYAHGINGILDGWNVGSLGLEQPHCFPLFFVYKNNVPLFLMVGKMRAESSKPWKKFHHGWQRRPTDGEGFGTRGKLDHIFHIEITKETKKNVRAKNNGNSVDREDQQF